jgi:Amt family ammonium transporter
MGGILGTVATGILATSAVAGAGISGWVDGNFDQVLKQLYGGGIAIVWSGGLTLLILKIVNVLMGLRVSDDVEIEGLDLNLHGEIIH